MQKHDPLYHGAEHPSALGYSLGPSWKEVFRNSATSSPDDEGDEGFTGGLRILYEEEVVAMKINESNEWSPIFNASSLKPLKNTVVDSDDSNYPVLLQTDRGNIIGADLIICALGVEPLAFIRDNQNGLVTSVKPSLSEEGWIKVDKRFRTSIKDVYAAGDCCSIYTEADHRQSSTPPSSSSTPSSHWFQMKLWSQAKMMGVSAAHSIVDDIKSTRTKSTPTNDEDSYGWSPYCEHIALSSHFNFNSLLFTHITHFFGFRVILLGRYNAQGLYSGSTALRTLGEKLESSGGSELERTQESLKVNDDFEFWYRVTHLKEYIKLVVCQGKLVGALLIGDTEMEETCENLILNATDIGSLGISLLDPDLDVEDFFD